MKVNQADILNQYNAARLNNQINKNNTTDNAGNTDKSKQTNSGLQELMDSYKPEGNTKTGDTLSAYANPKFAMDIETVQKLMKETEEIQGSVHQMIRGLMERQGINEAQLNGGQAENMTVDEAAREKAQELIGPGGELSPEKVSDRIVDFSIAVFGGDTSKIDIIRGAIDRGFDEAERMLGGLADVSKETYTLIQEKLDKWVEGGDETHTAPEEAESL